jgi:hypothetical protein
LARQWQMILWLQNAILAAVLALPVIPHTAQACTSVPSQFQNARLLQSHRSGFPGGLNGFCYCLVVMGVLHSVLINSSHASEAPHRHQGALREEALYTLAHFILFGFWSPTLFG